MIVSMIESVLHFFKIHGKMIFGNTPIIVQDMLCKTPESLNTVNVVLGLFVDHPFGVVDRVVFPQAFEGVVAPEFVGVVDRSLPGFLPDDSQQLFLGHVFHYSRIHLAVSLQKAKYDVFPGRTTSALALPPAAKVALVHLHLAVQFATLKFSHMVNRFTQTLVDAGNRLIIEAKVMRKSVRRLLLVEALHNGDLSSYALQGLLFSTWLVPTPYIPARGLHHLERTTEYTLFTPQKVGRAPENVLLSCNHKDILPPRGYETH